MKNTFVFKTELALAYFPHDAQSTARRKLMTLIHSSKSVFDELVALGYRESQRQFTPPQMALITSTFGNPLR